MSPHQGLIPKSHSAGSLPESCPLWSEHQVSQDAAIGVGQTSADSSLPLLLPQNLASGLRLSHTQEMEALKFTAVQSTCLKTYFYV